MNAEQASKRVTQVPTRLNFGEGQIDLRDTGRWLLGWVICGGESTPLARPMHPDWARRLRDQCVDVGIPFLFKQWGEWAPKTICHILKPEYAGKLIQMVTSVSSCRSDEGQISYWAYPSGIAEESFGPLDRMTRAGKEKPKPLLDGREWMEFPGVRESGTFLPINHPAFDLKGS